MLLRRVFIFIDRCICKNTTFFLLLRDTDFEEIFVK